MKIIELWKDRFCSECDGLENKSCCDLDGDLIDEQIKICIQANPNLLKKLKEVIQEEV